MHVINYFDAAFCVIVWLRRAPPSGGCHRELHSQEFLKRFQTGLVVVCGDRVGTSRGRIGHLGVMAGHVLRTEVLPMNSCGEVFGDLYVRGELLDVVIRVDGDQEERAAHMCVLAAASPVLRKMLTGGFKESRTLEKDGRRVITLQEVSSGQVKNLLDWIYTGTCRVQSTLDLMSLGKLADALDVQPLHCIIVKDALHTLNAGTCAYTLQCAHECCLHEIKDAAFDFALANFDEVARTDGFLDLGEDLVGALLASDHLQSSCEEAVYEHVIRWMLHPPTGSSVIDGGDTQGSGRVRGTELLRHLRFPLMDGQYLALEIHQKTNANADIQDCWLLKSLTTEAALWQIVPAESKHLFKLQHLSRAVLRPRHGSWRFSGSHIRHVLRGHREEVQALKIWEVCRSPVGVECGACRQGGNVVLISRKCVSAQGKLISGSVDWSMSVWDTWTCHCEAKLVRHQGAVCALEVATGRLFSGSVDRTVCVWDMTSWSCLHVLEGHSKSVFVLKALGSWLLSGSDDGSIKVWSLDDIARLAVGAREGSASAGKHGSAISPLPSAPGSEQNPPAPNQSLFGVRAEGSQIESRGEEVSGDKILPIHTLADHSKAVCALEAHGQHIFSGSFDGTIRVWDRDTLVCKQILKGHQGGVCTMVVCAGRLISGSVDIRIWRLEDLTLERILHGHNGGVNELAVAEQENKLLGGFDDALIRVWDTETWEVERVLEGHVGKFPAAWKPFRRRCLIHHQKSSAHL